MDWIDKWNEALEMLEKSLTAEISLDDIARTACCTTFHFQRMFSYLADMPLSEYIRRRKMTKAAFDLQRGAKVIDVALKYGYRSPTAFTRAFQSIHGITPSQAKAKGAPLKAFPPIRFQMTVKGVTALDYRMEAKPVRKKNGNTGLASALPKKWNRLWKCWNCLLPHGQSSPVQAPCQRRVRNWRNGFSRNGSPIPAMNTEKGQI